MDIKQLRHFLGLADELHFWRSSEQMNITQSTLSRQIKALEEELGIPLFDRNKRNVRLTTAGAFLRDEWQRLLAELDDVHRYARQINVGEAGAIRIGYPGSITHSFLPDLLTRLSTRHPELRVELMEIIVVDIEDSLLRYQVDVLFTRIPAVNPGLASRFLFAEPFALVVPESHPITAETFSDLQRVRDERFILPALHNRNHYTDLLVSIFQTYQYTPNVCYESDFGSTILSLVARGLGISILPLSYSYHAPLGVRFIKLDHHSTLHMLWRKENNSPTIQNLLNTVNACLPIQAYQ